MKTKLTSIKNINYKLFIALLFMGLCPTIYTTLRVFWLGQLPGEYNFSIAGQLSWVNLFYEVINEAIILPLFFFIGQAISNKKELSNRLKSGLLVALGSYLILTFGIMIFAEPLLALMATSKDIIYESSIYIKIESIANIFSIMFQFTLVILLVLNKDKEVYLLTFIKLILCSILDIILVSSLPVSLKLGVNGIAVSNIVVNLILFVITLLILSKEEVTIFNKDKIDFDWTKDFFKVGGISGLESLVRNLFYMLMICRMVNVVGEQGTYWVANNFIWGWLLLPIIQLGELIKQEISLDKNNLISNLKCYFIITSVICIIWIITIPLYKPFMQYVLQFKDADKLFELVMVLLGFYVLYAFQNIFDSIFYGLGKTNYMLFESIVTNTIYYGICFVLYITNLWEPSLLGISLMFGIGNAFDSIVSLIVFYFFLKRNSYNIILRTQ